MLSSAALYPASTRLAVAVACLIAFALVTATRWDRPVPALPVAVLALIVVGWLFGATLVWGTGYVTKLRWAASWGYDGHAWQWSALLAVAVAGVLSLGLALRSFAHRQRDRARIFAAATGAAFLAWSVFVQYSVVLAVAVLAAGVGSLAAVAHEPQPDATTRMTRRRAERGPP
jgi:hypothetical protein